MYKVKIKENKVLIIFITFSNDRALKIGLIQKKVDV